jgi:large subunit ribosomal protein L22
MEAIAKTKYLKGSPRKARLVIDMIRGQNVSRALSILKFTDKRAADPIAKCLNSAIANATYKAEQANVAIDPDGLWVRTCFIDMGPTKNRRRVRPAPQGRAYREQRHYCHITIELTSEEKVLNEKEQKRADAAAKAEGNKAKAPKKSAKKADAPKAEKKAKAKVEAPADAAVEEATSDKQPTASESAVENNAAVEADIADAKDASTQTPAEMNAEKPADDKMQDINEELEKQ